MSVEKKRSSRLLRELFVKANTACFYINFLQDERDNIYDKLAFC